MFAHVQAHEHDMYPDLPLDKVWDLDAASIIEREALGGVSHERKGQGRLFLPGLPRHDHPDRARACPKAHTTWASSGRADARTCLRVDRQVPKTFIDLRLRAQLF
jgi:hypothetical protein